MSIKSGISNFITDISNFFRSGSVLGVDIGTSSIKAVEISKKEGYLYLENYGILNTKDYLTHSNLALYTSSLNIVEEETARLLRLTLDEMKTESDVAIVSIPSFAAFSTILDLPLMSRKETTNSINFQAKKYIPMPVEKVSVDWFKVDEYADERGNKYQKIFLVGFPKNIINSFSRIFRGAGLKPLAMELDAMALVKALSKFRSPTLIIDIGAQFALMVIAQNGVVKYTGQTDYGGLNITRAVSKGLDLGMLRAEELKKSRGLLGKGGQSGLSTLIPSFLDVIIQEVEYVRRLYDKKYSKEIEQFVLTGGGGNLLGMEDYFSKRLNLPAAPSEIFMNIKYPSSLEPAMNSLRRELAIPIGLTHKYLSS